ncbi:AraC family transcriptional regulator [Hydrogenoanaerobacterium saccharovorans]|uniref:Transcriptional regulator, AraC family n=1 Tax=Hydrogenoanaerobacterium saccharovorans TaxID=474960 RepID=A0A1H8BRT6_9FIRM|nr:response regulator transcription factor [Hydrogenoanaerobacterium saccharovorans]RPF47278.1 AraC family transcriptional regulator [Hydrogenoanaerobacterium saccharovorans]SEM85279.1 transcriptional regulator, AraC family [Hydrogenoanaerobacterium saccharovorans]
MKCTDPGVLPGSDYYFATPSVLAKNLFYYLLCAGSYTCEAGYHIRRKNYNSILLMYVLEGSCTVQFEGRTYVAESGDIMLLNCYKPHEYYTNDYLKSLWLHFDGSQSLEFAENILKTQGVVLPCENPTLFISSINSIMEIFRKHLTISEPSVSCIIHTLLCNLVSVTSVSGALEIESGAIFDAINFIKTNYCANITVDDISKYVSVSPSHLSRMFKKQTGYSPYEYLLKVRLDNAKSLLKKTDKPVAEIAALTGFNSSSNFIYTFQSRTGISPNKFRHMPF